MFTSQVMRPRTEWITPDVTVQEAARKMCESEVGCLPVGEDNRLVGIITDRDITCRAVAEGWDPKTTPVREIMSKGVVYCFDDNDVEEAAWHLEKKRLHRIVVLDKDKRLVGMLSLSDIATNCAHDLTGEVMQAISSRAR
jgi:CBS domain-containing protein